MKKSMIKGDSRRTTEDREIKGVRKGSGRGTNDNVGVKLDRGKKMWASEDESEGERKVITVTRMSDTELRAGSRRRYTALTRGRNCARIIKEK